MYGALQHPHTLDTCIAVLVADAQRPNLHASSSATFSPTASLHSLSAASERAIRAHLSVSPEQHVQPAALAQAAALPRLPSGKYDRLSISQLEYWRHVLCGRGVNDSEHLPDVNLRSGSMPPPPTEARHSELSVMHACMNVLAGSPAAIALEPTTNLLEAGVNSIQVAALAALLCCEAGTVFLHPTPRGLQRALSAAAQREDEHSAPVSDGVGSISQSKVSVMPAATEEGGDMQAAEAAASSAVPVGRAVGSAQGCSEAVQFDSYQREYGCRGRDSVRVLVSDTRGEQAVHWMSRHHLPVGSGSVGSSESPGADAQQQQQQRQQQQQQQHRFRWHEDQQNDCIILDKMNACVDAPLTCIQQVDLPAVSGNHNLHSGAGTATTHSCDNSTAYDKLRAGADDIPQWLLVCSHACDIACILLHTSLDLATSNVHSHKGTNSMQLAAARKLTSTAEGAVAVGSVLPRRTTRRLWTATVGSSPDAGLQVTACGRCAAVACIRGDLELLRLRSGERLACVDTSGHLRR